MMPGRPGWGRSGQTRPGIRAPTSAETRVPYPYGIISMVDSDRPRVTIVVRLAKVVELALGELGLTVNQYRALTLIAAGTSSMREFAVRLAMKPPNLSTLIDGLAGQGLVSSERDRADRRRIILSLTSRGRRLLSRAEARTGAALAMVASYDPERERALLTGLEDWQFALDGVADDLFHNLGSPTPAAGKTAPRAAARL